MEKIDLEVLNPYDKIYNSYLEIENKKVEPKISISK